MRPQGRSLSTRDFINKLNQREFAVEVQCILGRIGTFRSQNGPLYEWPQYFLLPKGHT